MSKPLSPRKIEGLLLALDWTGHVELPSLDIRWLSEELVRILNGTKKGRCESCSNLREILVTTPLGAVCEPCIEEFARIASDERQQLE